MWNTRMWDVGMRGCVDVHLPAVERLVLLNRLQIVCEGHLWSRGAVGVWRRGGTHLLALEARGHHAPVSKLN